MLIEKIGRYLLILGFLFFVGAGGRPVAAFDHSLYDVILKGYVNESGLVDYNGISRDERFDRYIASLEQADPTKLSRDGQLAFWLNAYNALTIDHVIEEEPDKSVRETLIPGVWTSTSFFKDELRVAGRRMSLDNIEHKILRPKFEDPRIHFAIVCASMGCPPLPRIAYTAENVQRRLKEETRDYLNSDRGTRIDREEHVLYVSRLFDWYREDFVGKAGSIEAYIRPYLKEEIAQFLKTDPEIKFLHYDWSLNAQERLR